MLNFAFVATDVSTKEEKYMKRKIHAVPGLCAVPGGCAY
jgi:hypothetical protein